MKLVKQSEKIGLALTENELDDIVNCVEEVATRMDVTADKGWGTPFIKNQVSKLKVLALDLQKIRDKYQDTKGVTNENCKIEYEGLPEENCNECD